MLVQKLWNNEFSIDILQRIIKSSYDTYHNLLSTQEKITNNRSKIISFISDDIYEFDTISRFTKTMIDLGIETQKWNEISQMIKRYNSTISNNSNLFKNLQYLQTLHAKDSDEYKFLSKIINGTLRNGVNLQQTKFNEVNEKINLIERKLLTDFLEKAPQIELNEAELAGVPQTFINQYYDNTTKKYNIKLDKNMYTICNKFVNQSSVRRKIDDVLHTTYQRNIPKLSYLFIYKHVKANMLGYKSYLNYITQYSPEEIQNILNVIITRLSERSEIETKILSDLKNTYENDAILNTWDISYYVNKWKMIYGINENDISPYFEMKHTFDEIVKIISQMFQISFVEYTNYKKWDSNVKTYRIIKNKNVIGEVTFDLYGRSNKITGNQTVCISNRCCYPNEKKNNTIATLIVYMNIPYSQNVFLSLNDLCALFNEFGKIIYYISCSSNYSLFGGMYSNIETVDAIGKFIELVFFNNNTLKKISRHYCNGTQLSDKLVEKIIHHKKLDYGLAYKYQCLYGLYDLFVHSQIPFIDDCKNYMKIKDISKQKESIFRQMYYIYNTMYDAIFNCPNMTIHKESSHFHPIIWTYLFSGNENMNFLRILSDMHAHELLSIYTKQSNKEFLTLLTNFISQNTVNNDSLDQFIEHQVSPMPMLINFGLSDNDILQSLYNIEIPTLNKKTMQQHNSPLQYREDINKSLYISPETETNRKFNYFEQVSESDPKFKEIIDKVMK
jgi:Zn-dependent oligopeptidase